MHKGRASVFTGTFVRDGLRLTGSLCFDRSRLLSAMVVLMSAASHTRTHWPEETKGSVNQVYCSDLNGKHGQEPTGGFFLVDILLINTAAGDEKKKTAHVTCVASHLLMEKHGSEDNTVRRH